MFFHQRAEGIIFPHPHPTVKTSSSVEEKHAIGSNRFERLSDLSAPRVLPFLSLLGLYTNTRS